MSIAYNTSIVTSGLVFYYDMTNTQKSWKGPPATNIIPYSQDYGAGGNFASNWTGNLFGNWINSTVTTGFLAPDGTYTANLLTGYYSRWTASITATTSTTYTFSAWLKNYSLVNPPYLHVAFGLNGTLVNYNNITSIPIASIGDWTRYSVTVTSPSSGINQIQCGFEFAGSKSNSAGPYAMVVWGAQCEVGSYPTPYIPSLGTSSSRSTTQAIKDLTGNNTLTATSISYPSNGNFSFDGSYSYLQSTSNCGITGDVTLSAWINPSRAGQTGPHSTVICTDINYPYGAKLMNYKNNARYGIWLGWAGGGNTNYEAFVSTDINNSTDQMITASWTQSTGIAKIYLNGILQSTQSTGITSAVALANGQITVGTDYNSIGSGSLNKYLGTIYNASVYNRALSDDEVYRNFAALKGRYGL